MPTRQRPSPTGRSPARSLALAALPFVALALLAWPTQPDLLNSDFAQYLEHAEAIADGRPYTDTGYIYVPEAWALAPRAYPPGLPLLLSPLVAAFGDDLTAVKGLMLLTGVGYLLAAGAYFGREAGAWAGVGVALLAGLSPRFADFAVSPLSDVPFCALVWATLLVADHRGRWGWGRAVGVTVLAGLAIAFRPHGLVLLPVLLAWALVNARRVGWLASAPPALLLALALGARAALPAGSTRPLPSLGRAARSLTDVDPGQGQIVFEALLYPFPGDLPNDVYHWLALPLVALGLLAFAREDWRRLSLWFAVGFPLAVLASGFVSARYLWPMFPFVVFGLLNGLRVAVTRFRPRLGRVVPVTAAALLAAAAVVRGVASEHPPRRLDDPGLRRVFEFVREEEARGDVRAAFFRDRVLAWRTDASAMAYLASRDPEVHLRVWCRERITHVILGDLGMMPTRMADQRRAVAAAPHLFETALRTDGFEVLRVRRDRCPVAGAGQGEGQSRQ